MSYLSQDEAVPATVICLHSSGSSGRQWTRLRAMLQTKAIVLTPDFHGHGNAPDWSGADEDIVGADAAAIAKAVESAPGPVHFVGHSYGGAIALRVALAYPDRVASVAVYEPVAFRPLFDQYGARQPAAEVVEVARQIRRSVRAGDVASAAERFVDYWGGIGAWLALSWDQHSAISSRMRTIAAQFAGLARDPPRLVDYRALRTAALMLYGTAMRAPMRRLAELLRSALPNATFESLVGAGHLGPMTHADIVARRIADFIGQHAPERHRRLQRLAA